MPYANKQCTYWSIIGHVAGSSAVIKIKRLRSEDAGVKPAGCIYNSNIRHGVMQEVCHMLAKM